MKVEVRLDNTLDKDKLVICTKEMTDQVRDILNIIYNKSEDTISGLDNGKIYLLNPKDINYFYAETQKVFAKKKDGLKLQVKYKLYEIEELFNKYGFIRISNSVIANIKNIENLEMSFNGVLCIKFINGDKEYSSRRYVKKIKEYLDL